MSVSKEYQQFGARARLSKASCHSDRSWSDSDDGVEEPAFCGSAIRRFRKPSLSTHRFLVSDSRASAGRCTNAAVAAVLRAL